VRVRIWLPGRLFGKGEEYEDATDLGQGFDLQHARHDGFAGEMAREERLVETDVLHAGDGLPFFESGDPVHEEEGVAVRQNLEDAGEVQDVPGVFGFR
jgi:hypothetical protein